MTSGWRPARRHALVEAQQEAIMKKFFSFAVSMFIILTLCAPVFAQFNLKDAVKSGAGSFDGGQILHFRATLDSVDQDTSSNFSLTKYFSTQRDVATNPFEAQRTISSVLGAVNVSVFVDGSFDNSTWYAADTLADSTTSETAARITFDLNNKRFPYYRMRARNNATSRPDAIVDFKFWLVQ